MRIGYFDRAGRAIPEDVAHKLMEDVAYKLVKRDVLATGHTVSTVWLGLDHNYAEEGPPLIFETLVFPDQYDGTRYATEAEALEGHARYVAKWGDPARVAARALGHVEEENQS